MEGDDAIPVIGMHRGVPLEDQQSDARLQLVRAEIDHVLGMMDAVAFADWACNSVHSPESRQLAVAMAESLWTMAAETRANRPVGVDMDKVRASIAGLGSRRWRSPTHFGSDLDHDENMVLRDQPLGDDSG